MTHEFAAWPKTYRLFRDIVVTEKIDGTNAAIHISAFDKHAPQPYPAESYTAVVDGIRYMVSAQSRKRMIVPGKTTDNYGFAAWVYDNAAQLVRLLGEGLHFGEWWGHGIQRGYGRDYRTFSLFNVAKARELSLDYEAIPVGEAWLDRVPVLYEGPNDTAKVDECLRMLAAYGSVAVPGWAKPEGICVYHSASRSVSKVTLDANDAGKWEGVAHGA